LSAGTDLIEGRRYRRRPLRRHGRSRGGVRWRPSGRAWSQCVTNSTRPTGNSRWTSRWRASFHTARSRSAGHQSAEGTPERATATMTGACARLP